MDSDDRIDGDQSMPPKDEKKGVKIGSIDLKSMFKGDLAGMLSGVLYSITTLPFDKSGDAGRVICYGTGWSIILFRIGSVLIGLYKQFLAASADTHYEALVKERKHHQECRDSKSEIYVRLAEMQKGFDNEIAKVRSDYMVESTRLKGEFESHTTRHEREIIKVEGQRDFFEHGYKNLLKHLEESEGNKRQSRGSNEKGDPFNA